MTCNAQGTAYGSCQLQSCPAGYYKSGDQCVAYACTPNTSDNSGCSIANGIGIRYCNAQGTAWGSCSLAGCNNGFINQGGTCVRAGCSSGMTTDIKCIVQETCLGDGRIVSSSTQYPRASFNITGSSGQTVSIYQQQVSILDSTLTITRWDTYSATCDANGSGNWSAGTNGPGYCVVRKNLDINDYRCQNDHP